MSRVGKPTATRRVPSVRQGPFPSPVSTSRLADLSGPHISSFDFAVEEGLAAAVADIPAREIRVSSGDTAQVWLEEVSISYPTKSDSLVSDSRLFPAECRERGLTYSAPLNATVCRSINGGPVQKLRTKLGDVPIMVRSARCHLHGMSPLQLIGAGEEAVEFGGYFICNGIERIVRMLQIPKRNFPHAITRSAYTNRGPLYSNKGIMMRCVRPDQSGVTITMHYLTDGSATVRFALNRQEFFLPVIMVLKALVTTTDREIYERVLAGDTSNTYLSDRVLMLLRDAKRYESALHSKAAALAYLGARFRGVLDMPDSLSDVEAGQTLIDRFILVHLPKDATRDKFNLLILMLRKLYAFVRGDVLEDNPDALANQELLLTGHLVLMFLKEKLSDFLLGIDETIRREDSYATRLAAGQIKQLGPKPLAPGIPPNLHDAAYFKKVVDRQPDVGKKIYYLLATGNLVTKTGLDLMQVSGYTVVADKINFMRFTTHFRSVHRGQFFAEQKTTTVRKLLPENWGFLCPVHTPDGGPCGLLNHLSQPASVVAYPLRETSYLSLQEKVAEAKSDGDFKVTGSSFADVMCKYLVSLGMTPYSATNTVLPAHELPIMLDGRVLGGAAPHVAYRIARAIRRAKAMTGSVRAGLDRVAGMEPPAGQAEEVAALVRAAVLGLSDIATARKTFALAYANPSVTENPPPVPLPPSMEVAFLPPPWWDADVDPHLSLEEGEAIARGMLVSGAAGDSGKLVGLFPGLFLHTTPARIVRPVIQLDTGLVELLSPLEQPYLDIACTPEDVTDILHHHSDGKSEGKKLLYTHVELSPTSMLSEAAALTPFSDLNQSPRNMYQCQMGKQTMGTPVHSWVHRTDTKLFRLQNPQAPLVQAAAQSEYAFDEYPSGANAVVAVIAYTGYDMEDACIINKSSYERGFGHASVYKTHEFDLNEGKQSSDVGRFIFHNTYMPGEQTYRDPTMKAAKAEAAGIAVTAQTRAKVGEKVAPTLDEDGLPPIGALIRHEDPIYCVLDVTTGTHKIARHKELEPVYIDEVRIISPSSTEKGSGAAQNGVQKVSIKVRYNRNPVVGDKFSSRHGQKGVLSYLWPQHDMPFTDSGMCPDVIINPHAFPSRMTIGMLIESMAGKAGACHARFQDATPFRFDENDRVVDFFGQQMVKAGYNYYGTETMYSGVTGEPLHCDIYLGVVYYQRLRHMVSDKSQVRSTGPINSLTRQPVKGRKKHGGIRFGEMERDSLLAHGASFLLHDRLHNSSDRHLAMVCKGCGSMLSTYSVPSAATTTELVDPAAGTIKTSQVAFGVAADAISRSSKLRRAPFCRVCETGDHCAVVPMPYVFRYLANELAAMNIKIQMDVSHGPYEA